VVDVADCALDDQCQWLLKSAIAGLTVYVPMFTCGLLRSKAVA
jgi:hypothetical protein